MRLTSNAAFRASGERQPYSSPIRSRSSSAASRWSSGSPQTARHRSRALSSSAGASRKTLGLRTSPFGSTPARSMRASARRSSCVANSLSVTIGSGRRRRCSNASRRLARRLVWPIVAPGSASLVSVSDSSRSGTDWASSATEHPPPPRAKKLPPHRPLGCVRRPICALLRASRSGPGLRPIRLLAGALRGYWRLLSAWRFELWHLGGQGSVGLGELRDDRVCSPPRLPLLVQDRAEIVDLLAQFLNHRSTVYLSLTSSLRPALIQPYKDASVLPVRAQRTACYPLAHGIGADPQLPRCLPHVHPATSHVSRLRPVERPASVPCMVAAPAEGRRRPLDVARAGRSGTTHGCAKRSYRV